ncbi:MAG: nickel-dependent hydrogenase large subunit [Candidatus Odinarchaeota archaeon]|nr:nickel-dependent hydrogenase large subunit [Candidatus Odinarchaeota archaeon]
MTRETIIPFGPYHYALEEPIMFKLSVLGEKIVDVDIKIGHAHRGIEYLMEKKRFEDCIRLAERVCAICTQPHSECFTRGVEKIVKIDPPERAKYIRTIVFELNRIESHLLILGLTAHLMGFDTVFMHLWAFREAIMQILEDITGNRVQYAITTIGGVRRDLSEKQISRALKSLDDLEKSINKVREIFEKDKTIRMRAREVGYLSKQDALKLNVVGPVARASGIDFDIRKRDPYLVYNEIDFDVIVLDEGDSWARTLVRLLEVFESLKILKIAFKNLPKGDIRSKYDEIPAGEVTSRVEAPRGELLYHIRTTGYITPERVKIRTPTIPNLVSAKHILVGGTLADAPVSIGSLDPCISCTNRVMIIDLKSGKSKFVRW